MTQTDPGRRSRILQGGTGPVANVSIALVSTVVFLVVVTLLIVNAPGWETVKQSFFNGAEARDSFPLVARAFLLNVKMFLIAEVLILIFALVIAILRGLPGPVFFPLRAMVIVYTDLFRGIPTILVVYLLGFGVPGLQLTGHPDRSGGLGRGLARARLQRVRGRGVPGRDRVDPPEPGGGGPLARALARPRRCGSSSFRRPSAV